MPVKKTLSGNKLPRKRSSPRISYWLTTCKVDASLLVGPSTNWCKVNIMSLPYEAKFSPLKWVCQGVDGRHMVYRPCPLCGHDLYEPVQSLKDFQFFTDSLDSGSSKRAFIQDCLCKNCALVYRNPSFTPCGFEVLFAEAGYSYGSTAQRPAEQIGWLEDHDLLRPGRVLLDVGCYEGEFLSKLPDTIVRMGVDLDFAALQRGKARDPSLHLSCCPFERYEHHVRPDVITMFHVLEHLPDPLSVLRRLADISAPDVRLIVEVPILEEGQTNDINGFFSIGHLTHFSKRTLKALLIKSGWHVTDEHVATDYNGYRVLAKATRDIKEPDQDNADTDILKKILASAALSVAKVDGIISNIPKDANVVIWGAGMHTEVMLHKTCLFAEERRRFLLVDSDRMKQDKTWRSIQIKSPDILPLLDWDKTWLLISTYQAQFLIRELAVGFGVPPTHIVQLYDEIKVC